MKQNFVQFFSPGTLFAEITEKEIKEWDIGKAKRMSKSIEERYGATPYAFQFLTRAREDNELDSKIIKKSPMYFVNCRVETLDEVLKRNDPKERILRSNMKNNGYDRIAVTTKGWKFTQPMGERDVCLP